jgi:thiamine biosynthesis lipoprotein
LSSVSVIAESSMRADAMSTAMFVMSPARGREWIDTLSGVECLVLGRTGDAYRSRGWDAFALKA